MLDNVQKFFFAKFKLLVLSVLYVYEPGSEVVVFLPVTLADRQITMKVWRGGK